MNVRRLGKREEADAQGDHLETGSDWPLMIALRKALHGTAE